MMIVGLLLLTAAFVLASMISDGIDGLGLGIVMSALLWLLGGGLYLVMGAA